MTTIYFIRHAESDRTVRDGRVRPLTDKGMIDRALVTNFLEDKQIDIVLSSPYKRAVDTVADFAEEKGFTIETIEDFHERRSSSEYKEKENDFNAFLQHQWEDFSYTLSDGECLFEVQKRNICALNDVFTRYNDKNIVIGTHGMALSMIINYYDTTYGFEDFKAMEKIMPWVVKMKFDHGHFVGMWKIDLFGIN